MKQQADELSRMNALGASTSTKAAAGGPPMMKDLGNLGATVKPLTPSNNPGPMTSPSSQGPTMPGSKQAHK